MRDTIERLKYFNRWRRDIQNDGQLVMPCPTQIGKDIDAAIKGLEERAELLEALRNTHDWLSSFSMPPTSTIEEKQEAMREIESAIAKATIKGNP